MKWTLLLLAALSAACAAQEQGKAVVCYVGTWATYRPGHGKFEIEDIEPDLCTHVIYAFAALENNVIVSFDPVEDLCENDGMCGFERFVGLKKKNANLKTILGIGGWNEGSKKYSQMAASSATRKTFVDSVVAFLAKYGFDGLDMDWEYPTQRGGSYADKENYVYLLQELKAAFEPHGYLLSAALPAGQWAIDQGYKVKEIFEVLDFGNIMNYDYHGSWEYYVHHHAPMHKHPQDDSHYFRDNVMATLEHYIELGAVPSKMMMGLPLYGRAYKLASVDKTDIYSCRQGDATAGPYTQAAGMLGYNEICEMWLTDKENWVFVRDPYLVGPYATYNFDGGADNRNQWIGYDDETSILEKATLIGKYGLGGSMFWSLETDDFRGLCGNTGTYPLVNAVKGYVPPPPPPTTTRDPDAPTTTSPPTTTHGTTQPPIPPGDKCKKEGMNDEPNDCETYYQCWIDENNQWQYNVLKCGAGTAFNPANDICDWCSNVPGCDC